MLQCRDCTICDFSIHIRKPVHTPDTLLIIQLPASAPWEEGMIASVWAPATHVEDPDGVPHLSICTVLVMAVVAIWGLSKSTLKLKS